MRSRHHWLVSATLFSALINVGCTVSSESASAERSAGQQAPTVSPTIAWPETSSVLDGTDLLEMQEVELVALDIEGVGGQYSTEQGGSILTLNVHLNNNLLEAERRYEEPEMDTMTRTYQFSATSEEGAVAEKQDAFLKQTRAGVLLWEKDSGVEGIPDSYWIHYIRQP